MFLILAFYMEDGDQPTMLDSAEGTLLIRIYSLYSPVARILCPPLLSSGSRHWWMSDGGSAAPLEVGYLTTVKLFKPS